ncbi:hypothetical protein 2 [Forsythia suspensa luteo-like virus]|nr:hypothetical protein 2 [Forsythia suspensa luteo-like virus]
MENPQSFQNGTSYEPGDDPTSPFWAHGKYVGPYWSNGRVQSSVEFGDEAPIDELDELARLHDTAYAHWQDEAHREAADAIFAEEARKLKGKYGSKLAANPKLAAAAVEYGNYTARSLKKLVKDSTQFAALGPFGIPLGLAKNVVQNMLANQARIRGTHLARERADVLKYYSLPGAGVVRPRGVDTAAKTSHTPAQQTVSSSTAAGPRQTPTQPQDLTNLMHVRKTNKQKERMVAVGTPMKPHRKKTQKKRPKHKRKH